MSRLLNWKLIKVNVEVPSPISGVLGSITVKEGETVNVGSLLGTVDGSSAIKADNVKEANNYSPPIKNLDKITPKVLKIEKKIKNKKNRNKRNTSFNKERHKS